jgi:hypothetical protein
MAQSSTPPRAKTIFNSAACRSHPQPHRGYPYPCPGSLILLVPASRRIYPRPSHVPKLASTLLLAMASLATATHRSYPRPCFLTKLGSPPCDALMLALTQLPTEAILSSPSSRSYPLPRRMPMLSSTRQPPKTILSSAALRGVLDPAPR